MALDYVMAIATARTAVDIAASIDAISASATISTGVGAQSLVDGVAVRRGLYIRVRAARSPAWGDPVEEEFGFRPTVSIFFRLNKFQSLDDQVTDIMFLATGLFAAMPDDMIVYSWNPATSGQFAAPADSKYIPRPRCGHRSAGR